MKTELCRCGKDSGETIKYRSREEVGELEGINLRASQGLRQKLTKCQVLEGGRRVRMRKHRTSRIQYSIPIPPHGI